MGVYMYVCMSGSGFFPANCFCRSTTLTKLNIAPCHHLNHVIKKSKNQKIKGIDRFVGCTSTWCTQLDRAWAEHGNGGFFQD